MKFRNFTPHTINLIGVGELLSEGIARLTEERREVRVGWTDEGIPFTSIHYSGVEGFPPDFTDTGDIYIVSRPVAEFVNLPCVVSPDQYVRDDKGQIIAAKGLCWFPPV